MGLGLIDIAQLGNVEAAARFRAASWQRVSPFFRRDILLGQLRTDSDLGHFGCTCYEPLFVFKQFGSLERCTLRPGNITAQRGGAQSCCR